MSRRSLALAAAMVPVLSGAVAGQPAAEDAAPAVAPYQRVVEERGGEVVRLQMAVREFSPAAEPGPKIFLAAAVHIGNQDFYDGLQEFLDAQEVVLFEGVKPPGAGLAEHEERELSDAEKAEVTARRVRFLATAVERFRAKEKRLPGTLDELAAESGGRLGALVTGCTADAWGRPIAYIIETGEGAGAPGRFDVVSLGADGAEGGEDANADVRYSRQKPVRLPKGGERGRGIQQQLADGLGLVFQLTAMNHDKPHWRNSDLSLDQVQARLESAGASADMLFGMLDGSSFLGRMAGLVIGIATATPESRAMLRVMFIDLLGRADALMGMPMPGEMDKVMGVLLEERNRVVIADLRRILATEPGVGTIAVIYGAGHLPGIERSLTADLGYRPVGDTWRTAMDVDAAAAGIPPERLRMLRETMARSIQMQIDRARRPRRAD